MFTQPRQTSTASVLVSDWSWKATYKLHVAFHDQSETSASTEAVLLGDNATTRGISPPKHRQTISQIGGQDGLDNLIAKAAIVFIDIFRVDVVAGFFEGITNPPPSHGHEVDGVLKGENV